jgi:hypothetical protein
MMRKTVEDDLLPDGINSVMLASTDGELHDGWELRSKYGVFIGTTVDELVDNISKSGLSVNAIMLTALLVQLEMDGLALLVEEDMETLMAC